MGHNNVTKPKIKLEDAARTFKKAGQLHAHTMIVRALCNGLRYQRVRIEDNCVIGPDCAYIGEYEFKVFWCIGCKASQKVNISRRTGFFGKENMQKQSTFENEIICIL